MSAHHPSATRPRRAFVWSTPDQPWSRHLDRIVIPTPRFDRSEGPRLHPFPDWPRPAATTRTPPAPRP